MRTEQILSADILDILFDNRNKSYGAYDLRKHYSKRLIKAIAVTFMACSGVVFLFVMFKKDRMLAPFIPDVIVYSFRELPKDIKPEPLPKPKLPPMKPAVKAPAQLFVKNFVITKIESQATRLAINLDSVAISGRTVTGPANIPVQVGDPLPGNDGANAPIEPERVVDKITPLYSAEVMPAFPGGMEALHKFLQKHLHNPEEMEQGQMVSVKIKFVVGYEGKLKSFEIVEDGGTIFNNEVIRVLKKMPGWIPGKSNGESVSVYYTIPVKFTAAE